jgi:hypothetical protein
MFYTLVNKSNNYHWPKKDLMQKILLVSEKVKSVCTGVFSTICIYNFCTALQYMQSPHYRYRVMTSCWNEDASQRPSFKELTETFDQMLEDTVEYLDLNPCIVHNSPRDIQGKSINYPRRKCKSSKRCLINYFELEVLYKRALIAVITEFQGYACSNVYKGT